MNEPVGIEYADLYFRFPEITDDEIDDLIDFLEEESIKCEGATDVFMDKNNQITQLTNNWNELEEWLKDMKTPKQDNWGDYGYTWALKIDVILDKMKEIKEKNNV